jgi:hypothetical protein
MTQMHSPQVSGLHPLCPVPPLPEEQSRYTNYDMTNNENNRLGHDNVNNKADTRITT